MFVMYTYEGVSNKWRITVLHVVFSFGNTFCLQTNYCACESYFVVDFEAFYVSM